MVEKLKIAVAISGRGSNLQALIDACAHEDFPARIVHVVSNRTDAYGLVRAAEADIPTSVVDHRAFESREAFDGALDEVFTGVAAELVCLAGFMRLLTAEFVNRWRDRLINIHPSLLPAFRGVHTHERALDAGVRLAGCTVHFVRAEMDSGPIIAQAAVPVRSDDTPEGLAERVLALEHRIYPLAVRLFAEGRLRVRGERVEITGMSAAEGALINPLP